ncbi:MAG: O-antigen ligase family protein [Micromonosporaceae bacterium]
MLLAALAAAVVGQGGFFGAAQWCVTALMGVAVVLAAAGWPFGRDDLGGGFVAAGVLFAVWALVRAAGAPAAGLSWVLFGAGTAAVFVVCRRLDTGSRGLVVDGLVAVGAVVAATGWLGVVAHHRPWGLPSAGLWRAASVLTYANAAAALLVALTVVVLSRLTASPGSVRLCLTAAGLLCGVGATLSRAGVAALAVGVLVLCLLRGTRVVVRAAAGPAAGAAVAFAGLLPSVPAAARPDPAVALAALACGAGIAVVMQRSPRAAIAVLTGGAALCAALILINAAPSVDAAARSLAASRISLASPARAGETSAAIRVIGRHPLVGAGPGRATLRWRGPDGSIRADSYSHDEYLQVLADLGIIGTALLTMFIAAAVRVLWQARLSMPGPAWAGAVAAAAALAVHSGFDFLWHIPAIPLTVAALAGCAVTSTGRPQPLKTAATQREEKL